MDNDSLNENEPEVTLRQVFERIRLLGENLRYRELLEEEVRTKTRQLHEGQERYQRLLESVTSYVYTVFFEEGRPVGTVHQSGCEKVTGYTPAEYHDNPGLWYDIIHEDDRSQALDLVHRISTASEPLETEHRILHKNGSTRWIRSTLVPCRDMEGALHAYDGIISDITERKQADINLRESEERFSQIFHQHEDAIVIFKLDTFEIIDANPAATGLYGYCYEDLKGPFPWPFLTEDHHELQESLKASLIQDKRFDVAKTSHLRKDGTTAVVSMRGKVVTLMDNDVVYCSFRDISEKIRLEEHVRDTQAKLIHANKMASLGMLASGIAHEINNPNNFIMFNSALLAETWQAASEALDEHSSENGDFYLGGQRFSEVREETPHLISGLAEGARRIQAIVGTLKGFVSQDSAGAAECIDINRIVQMALTLLSHEIRNHSSKINVELGSDLPHISGKSQQIEQVVINLVTNALHAVENNCGEIRIATSCDHAAGFVIVTVADTGCGMTREELEHAAEPFYTTRSAQGGTGLGVSISLSIVREHNGTLNYSSLPGNGTTATVQLPVSGCLIKEEEI